MVNMQQIQNNWRWFTSHFCIIYMNEICLTDYTTDVLPMSFKSYNIDIFCYLLLHFVLVCITAVYDNDGNVFRIRMSLSSPEYTAMTAVCYVWEWHHRSIRQ